MHRLTYLLALFSLLLSLVAVAQMTDEEKLEKQKVLQKFADEKTRQQIEQQDKGMVEKTKEAVSDTYQNLKKKLPENLQNMLPGENTAPTKVEAQAPKEVPAESNELDPELQALQNEAQAIDPDQEITTESGMKIDLNAAKGAIDPEKMQQIIKNLENNPMLKMLSAKQKEAAAQMMQKNPFAEMGKSAVKTTILAKMDASKPAGKFIHDHPKLVDFVADWVVDDKAIPAFVSIIVKKEKAKIMGGVFVAVLITVFLLNLKNSKKSIFKRILIKIAIMLGSFLVNAGSFYFIYREELGPTVDVAMRHL